MNRTSFSISESSSHHLFSTCFRDTSRGCCFQIRVSPKSVGVVPPASVRSQRNIGASDSGMTAQNQDQLESEDPVSIEHETLMVIL